MSEDKQRFGSRPVPTDDPEKFLKAHGYTIGQVLGEGTYAKVRLAEHEQNAVKERMAVKVICKKKAPNDYLEKFLPRELAVMRKLDHVNIIGTKEIFEFPNRVFVFMELAREDMLSFIKRSGAQKDEDARRMFRDVATGIAYCHSQDVVHRDLKCENLLLGKDGRIKIADFGFSRFSTDPVSGKRILSRTFCGSAAYAPPEVFQANPYNPRMYDVWSLGCILFVIVCASLPFDDSNIRKLLEAQIKKKIHFPSRVSKKIPDNCKALILRMLEADLTKRATMDQILNSDWMQHHRSMLEREEINSSSLDTPRSTGPGK